MPITLQTSADGRVIGPIEFGDAEIVSVLQERDTATVRLELHPFGDQSRIIQFRLENISLLFYAAGWFQNTVLDVYLFDDISKVSSNDDEFTTQIRQEWREIAARYSDALSSRRAGPTLYFNSAAENVLLVTCERFDVEEV
ncbi:MAG: hypothetical protein IOC49_08265 [Methylobacterium sp.]|nr:hypothetical protein [Methylobacterium sp.]